MEWAVRVDTAGRHSGVKRVGGKWAREAQGGRGHGGELGMAWWAIGDGSRARRVGIGREGWEGGWDENGVVDRVAGDDGGGARGGLEGVDGWVAREQSDRWGHWK